MSEPIGAGPRADFACLSKKCKTDEGATVYELPTVATRCPVCGSKRIARVWSGKAPGILASGSRAISHAIDAAGSKAIDGRNARNESAQRLEKDARELRALGIGVPGGVWMAKREDAPGMLGVGAGKGAPAPNVTPASMAPVVGRRLRTNVFARDE